MSVQVYIPGDLRKYCGGAAHVTVDAPTVRAVLAALARAYPAVHGGVCDETGAVRRHINLFINEANIRERSGLDTALMAGDVVTILPAVSGG